MPTIHSIRHASFASLLLTTLALLFYAPTPEAQPAQTQPASTRRPNIVIILADDVGFCDIGCYGSEIHTPNLDALANNGLRFTQFYNTARCCPSRTSILTGLYAHQAGVGHMTNENHDSGDGYVGELNDHCITIAQALKTAGYGTYALGKWHVTSQVNANNPDKHNWPIQRGFDRYYGTIIGAGSYFDPGHLCRDNTPISPFADKEYQPPENQPYYYTNAIGSQACRFIRDHDAQHHDQPLFMYVAFTAAHWPMHALPEDIAKYKGCIRQRLRADPQGPLRARKKAGPDRSQLGPQPPVWPMGCRERQSLGSPLYGGLCGHA